jgi:hypothetical protein
MRPADGRTDGCLQHDRAKKPLLRREWDHWRGLREEYNHAPHNETQSGGAARNANEKWISSTSFAEPVGVYDEIETRRGLRYSYAFWGYGRGSDRSVAELQVGGSKPRTFDVFIDGLLYWLYVHTHARINARMSDRWRESFGCAEARGAAGSASWAIAKKNAKLERGGGKKNEKFKKNEHVPKF